MSHDCRSEFAKNMAFFSNTSWQNEWEILFDYVSLLYEKLLWIWQKMYRIILQTCGKLHEQTCWQQQKKLQTIRKLDITIWIALQKKTLLKLLGRKLFTIVRRKRRAYRWHCFRHCYLFNIHGSITRLQSFLTHSTHTHTLCITFFFISTIKLKIQLWIDSSSAR